MKISISIKFFILFFSIGCNINNNSIAYMNKTKVVDNMSKLLLNGNELNKTSEFKKLNNEYTEEKSFDNIDDIDFFDNKSSSLNEYNQNKITLSNNDINSELISSNESSEYENDKIYIIDKYLNEIYFENNSDLNFDNFNIIEYDPSINLHLTTRYWPLSEIDIIRFKQKLFVLAKTLEKYMDFFEELGIYDIYKDELKQLLRYSDFEIPKKAINSIANYVGIFIPYKINKKYSIGRVARVCSFHELATIMFYAKWKFTGVCDDLYTYDSLIRKPFCCQSNINDFSKFRPFIYTQNQINDIKDILNNKGLNAKTKNCQDKFIYYITVPCIGCNFYNLFCLSSIFNSICAPLNITYCTCFSLGNMYHNKFEKFIIHDVRYYPLKEVGDIAKEFDKYWSILNCISNSYLCNCAS